MTFEEAKDRIRRILTYSHPIASWELEDIMDALDITPCDISTCKIAKTLWGNKGNIPDIDISRVKNGTPLEAQSPDEDCISRETVLELAKKGILVSNDNYKCVVNAIKSLPSVKPERPKGKWIKYEVDVAPHPLHCSLCGFSNHHISDRYMKEFRRCPNCGAEMEVRDEKL